MMSYTEVERIAKDAAERAEKEGIEPLSVRGFNSESPNAFIRRIPFLGSYIPAGWVHPEELDDLFVDSSGMGNENEPALTVSQFAKKITEFQKSGENFGFGIAEAGQFQVVIR